MSENPVDVKEEADGSIVVTPGETTPETEAEAEAEEET